MLPAVVNHGDPPPTWGRVIRATFARSGQPHPGSPRRPAVWGASPRVVHLDEDLGAPRTARGVVREACIAQHLPVALQQIAVLLTSEVVTNAVRHGGGHPRICVDAAPGGISVGVGDDDDRYPVLRVVGLDAPGGRGIGLLDRLADAWGVTAPSADGTGKVVWFELRAA